MTKPHEDGEPFLITEQSAAFLHFSAFEIDYHHVKFCPGVSCISQ